MLRKFYKVFTPKEVKTISKSFQKIKNNPKIYPRYFCKNDIYSYNILENNALNSFFNSRIYTKLHKFSDWNEIELHQAFLEWNINKDIYQNYRTPLDHITCVFSDRKVNYEYFFKERNEGFITPNDILIYDNDIPIKFFKQKEANLAILLFAVFNNHSEIKKDEKQFPNMVSSL